MNIRIPAHVVNLINILESAGHEAYAVGGCVRDSLLNRTPNDWDICTSARPEQMQECFKDYRTIETGLKHGTLTVMLGSEPYEITTFREDGEYEDCRHPKDVRFVGKLQTDLARRDFTVNAMAAHPEKGVMDFYGGIDDLNNKLIRCVGEPDKRFNEDALRILRAMRFAGTLNFNIEEKTEQALFRNSHLLKKIAAERVIAELRRTLNTPNAPVIMNRYRKIYGEVIPEWLCYSDEEWTKLCRSLYFAPRDIGFRLSILFSGVDTEKVKASLKALKWEKALQNKVITLKESLNIELQPATASMCRFLNKLGKETAREALFLRETLFGSQTELFDAFEYTLRENYCYTLKELAVDGKDLRKAGFERGREIGEILEFLLCKVMDGELPNDRETLLKEIFKNLKKSLDK